MSLRDGLPGYCAACGHARVFHQFGTGAGVPIGQAFCDDRHDAPCGCQGFTHAPKTLTLEEIDCVQRIGRHDVSVTIGVTEFNALCATAREAHAVNDRGQKDILDLERDLAHTTRRADKAEAKQTEMLNDLRGALADDNTWTWGGTVKRVMDMRHTLAKTSLERDSAVRMRDAIQKDMNVVVEQRQAAEKHAAEAEAAPGNYEGYLSSVTVDQPEPHIDRSWDGGVKWGPRAPARVTLDLLLAPGTTRKVKFVLDAGARKALSYLAPYPDKTLQARLDVAEHTLDAFTRECGEVVNACGSTPDRDVVLGWLRALRKEWDAEKTRRLGAEAVLAAERAKNANLNTLDATYAKMKQDMCDAVGTPRDWAWQAVVNTAKSQHDRAMALDDARANVAHKNANILTARDEIARIARASDELVDTITRAQRMIGKP